MRYESRPVAIYNAEEKKLLGIFLTTAMAIKYLFDTPTVRNEASAYSALHTHARIKKTKFIFPIAIRFANDLQKQKLANECFIIMDGYPIPHFTRMQGFSTNREALQKWHCKSGSLYG